MVLFQRGVGDADRPKVVERAPLSISLLDRQKVDLSRRIPAERIAAHRPFLLGNRRSRAPHRAAK
jgi:hypothetical protein